MLREVSSRTSKTTTGICHSSTPNADTCAERTSTFVENVPRLAEGKYLKLLYGLFDDAGVLGVTDDDLDARFCPTCDLGPICAKEHSVGKFSPLCLDGVATAVLQT